MRNENSNKTLERTGGFLAGFTSESGANVLGRLACRSAFPLGVPITSQFLGCNFNSMVYFPIRNGLAGWI